MQNKIKLSDVSHIFKLNDFTENNEKDADKTYPKTEKDDVSDLPPPASDKTSQVAAKSRAALISKDLEALSEEYGAAAKDTALNWLKVVGSESESTSPNAWSRASAAEDGRQSLVEARWRSSTMAERRDEDFSAERRLARKLAARFDNPVQAPPQTLAAALRPYIAAASFFAVVAGCLGFYFMSGGTSASTKNTSGERTQKAGSLAQKPIQARITPAMVAQSTAVNASESQAGEIASPKGNVQRTRVNLGKTVSTPPPIPAIGSVPPEEKGWIPRQVEKEPLSEEKPSGAAAPSAKTENWSDTVETFRQFMNAKPIPQEGSKESQLLEALEAWQNAKKTPK